MNKERIHQLKRFDPIRYNQNGPGWSFDPYVIKECDDGEYVKLEDVLAALDAAKEEPQCVNDTDGDGDCHLCHQYGGCQQFMLMKARDSVCSFTLKEQLDTVTLPREVPKFTCGPCGGNWCIWWGEGDYVWGFDRSMERVITDFVKDLNKKREQLAAALQQPTKPA